MGYTHHDKISGRNGLFRGARGSEVRIDTGTVQFCINFTGPSTAAESAYVAVPYDVTLVGAQGTVASGTVGTGANVQFNLTDTAGTALFGTAAFTSAGTAGAQTVTYGTTSTATITQGQVIAVTKASCATAYGATIIITMTRVGQTV